MPYKISELPAAGDVTANDQLAIVDYESGLTKRATASQVRQFVAPALNVLDYGAVGDGATDDTTAIQAAIDAAADLVGGRVYLPVPDVAYLITALDVPYNVSVCGAGAASLLRSAAASGAVITASDGALLSDFKLELTNNGAAIGINLVESRAVTVVERVVVAVTTGGTNDVTGIKVNKRPSTGTYAGMVRLSHNYLTCMKYAINLADTVTATAIEANCLVGLQSAGAPGIAGSIGINVDASCSGLSIIGNQVEGWETGLYARGTYLTYVGNYHETNTAHVNWAKDSGNSRAWGFAAGNWYLGAGTVSITATYTDHVHQLDISRDVYLSHGLFVGLAVRCVGALTSQVTSVASLPASPEEGMMCSVNDSNTATWGATVAAGGSNHVQVRYNGTNWTVVGA